MPETTTNPAQLSTELRTVVTRLMKKLRSHSPTRERLSLTERAVIRQLDEHRQLLPSELAAREKVTAQSMSQILRHLGELGYITRQPQAADKRKVLVSLSAAGLELLHTVRHERDEWLQQTLRDTCSEQELAQLHGVLPLLARLVEAD